MDLYVKNLDYLYRTGVLDQTVVAKAIGMTQSAISKIITGVTKEPQAATIAKICNQIGVSLDDLFFRDMSDPDGNQVSQPARLDIARLASMIEVVESAASGLVRLEASSKASIVAGLYMDAQVTPETARMAARAALNGVLASHRGSNEQVAKG